MQSASLTTARRPQTGPEWQSWGLPQWNEALLDYFFRVRDGDTTPVSRLVVTGEELRHVVGDDQTSPLEIRNSFQQLIQRRLRTEAKSLCSDARSLRRGRSETIPPFFGHLILTCLAAAESSEDGPPEGNFRARLNHLLGVPDKISYSLDHLPSLWEELRSWLIQARERGEGYRELILRRRPHLQLIGYSVELAFPWYKDQRVLIDLLTEVDLPSPPPVVPVLEILERGLSRFSEPFRHALQDFRQTYFQGQTDLYRSPLWSAVQDVLVRISTRGDTGARGGARALVRLDRDEDWHFVLSLYLDSPETGPLPRGLWIEPTDEFAVGRFEYLVRSDAAAESRQPVEHLLLEGQLRQLLPGIEASTLYRAVSDGVLLFIENEQGVWETAFSPPDGGEVRALVRTDLADRFVASLCATGVHPRTVPALYLGWSEVEGFSGSHLAQANFDTAGLGGIRSLQAVIAAPQVYLRGGVAVRNGWLGRRACLPEITVRGAARVTIQPCVEGDRAWALPPVALQPVPEDPACWRLPGPPGMASDLDGSYLIQARTGSDILANRRVEFRAHVIGHDFAWPKHVDRWLSEGGKTDMGEPGGDGDTSAGVTDSAEPPAFLRTHATPSALPPPRDQSTDAAETLAEIFAGLALRRSWIRESEILEWTRRVLGVEGRLRWDVVRAWVEAGCLESFLYRHWRLRCYFARKPRLIVHRTSGQEALTAVLQGLTTSSVRRQVEQASLDAGADTETRTGPSPWVPSLVVIRAASWQMVEQISSRVELDPPRWLLPLQQCVAAVEQIASIETELQKNHVLAGRWSWSQRRFVMPDTSASTDLNVEWYRREDAPDAYLVRQGDEFLWHTRSRNWAFLVASLYRGQQPFAPRSQAALARSAADGLYLPLPVGRWTTVTSGIPPGPVSTGEGSHDYIYTFCDRTVRDEALRILWPSQAPALLTYRARWLVSVLQASSRGGAQHLVALPTHVRQVLSTRLEPPESESLKRIRLVPRHLLAHLTALANALCRYAETSPAGPRRGKS
jgi:hypothetical protein